MLCLSGTRRDCLCPVHIWSPLLLSIRLYDAIFLITSLQSNLSTNPHFISFFSLNKPFSPLMRCIKVTSFQSSVVNSLTSVTIFHTTRHFLINVALERTWRASPCQTPCRPPCWRGWVGLGVSPGEPGGRRLEAGVWRRWSGRCDAPPTTRTQRGAQWD